MIWNGYEIYDSGCLVTSWFFGLYWVNLKEQLLLSFFVKFQNSKYWTGPHYWLKRGKITAPVHHVNLSQLYLASLETFIVLHVLLRDLITLFSAYFTRSWLSIFPLRWSFLCIPVCHNFQNWPFEFSIIRIIPTICIWCHLANYCLLNVCSLLTWCYYVVVVSTRLKNF